MWQCAIPVVAAVLLCDGEGPMLVALGLAVLALVQSVSRRRNSAPPTFYGPETYASARAAQAHAEEETSDRTRNPRKVWDEDSGTTPSTGGEEGTANPPPRSHIGGFQRVQSNESRQRLLMRLRDELEATRALRQNEQK